jgi:hypothetical protein
VKRSGLTKAVNSWGLEMSRSRDPTARLDDSLFTWVGVVSLLLTLITREGVEDDTLSGRAEEGIIMIADVGYARSSEGCPWQMYCE